MSKNLCRPSKDPYLYLRKLRRNNSGMLDRIYHRKHPLIISAKLPTCVEETLSGDECNELHIKTNRVDSEESPIRRNDSYSCNSSPRRMAIGEYSGGNDMEQRPLSAESGTYDDIMQTNDSNDLVKSSRKSVSPRPHLYMPPGPPSSPNPSLTINTPSNLSSQEMSPSTTSPRSNQSAQSSKYSNQVLRLRLRERRNAVCDSTSLSKGLRDFFVSYVMSDLTDSMTSSLNLENEAKDRANAPQQGTEYFTSSDEDMLNSDTSLCERYYDSDGT